ncbi:hypothetical protein XU18_4152 [Perkinsela sp. CCAP 1560/4]|nr:hypothetical protein XU18_4152 [Perkinsela sp. CCAP 1560/4]|eukprot:KNH04664.1 hypothetical protein XU18_4152 [Perkinsela sp. CCAP 1560/4]
MKAALRDFFQKLRSHQHSRHAVTLSFVSLSLLSVIFYKDEHSHSWDQFRNSTTRQNQERKIVKF